MAAVRSNALKCPLKRNRTIRPHARADEGIAGDAISNGTLASSVDTVAHFFAIADDATVRRKTRQLAFPCQIPEELM